MRNKAVQQLHLKSKFTSCRWRRLRCATNILFNFCFNAVENNSIRSKNTKIDSTRNDKLTHYLHNKLFASFVWHWWQHRLRVISAEAEACMQCTDTERIENSDDRRTIACRIASHHTFIEVQLFHYFCANLSFVIDQSDSLDKVQCQMSSALCCCATRRMLRVFVISTKCDTHTHTHTPCSEVTSFVSLRRAPRGTTITIY